MKRKEGVGFVWEWKGVVVFVVFGGFGWFFEVFCVFFGDLLGGLECFAGVVLDCFWVF